MAAPFEVVLNVDPVARPVRAEREAATEAAVE